jgi:rhamnogalacturonyl hydrolase YesR
MYLAARLVKRSMARLPDGKRLPQGWSAVPVGDSGDGLQLDWPEVAGEGSVIPRPILMESRLRVTVALDYREAQYVEVYLRGSGELVGSLDIRYAYTFQPFELVLTAPQTEAVLREGVRLCLGGGNQPLWIFDELGGDTDRASFAPHLLVDSDRSTQRMERALDRITSLSSLQPFGWLEGCVLDGLYSLRKELGADRIDKTIEAHLRQFLDPQGRLIYEDLHGRRADGSFTTIEATLPLAVIVKHRPDHPVVQEAVAFWDARGMNGGEGAVIDDHMVTAEGAYTVAYPLAAIATRLGREDLAQQAIRQLLIRRDALVRDRHVYLRYDERSGTHSFRSWARAYAWYMLGMTRTWIELADSNDAHLLETSGLALEITRVAEAAVSWRQPDGLWSCFLDEPETGIDTSGSAGIAAALALGANRGLLPPAYITAAEKSLRALEEYLTPDGLLSGVAQHNAGGMELQRGGYRVLSQMGLGLWAQLYAAVHS